MLKTEKRYGEKICLWCGEQFTASKSNQVYCRTECTRRASNQKIIERYHANKRLRADRTRYCECGTKLSRYNDENTCSACKQGQKEIERIELLKRLGFGYINEE